MIAAWPKVTFDEAPLEIIDGDRGKNYPKQDEFFENGHCLFLNTGNVTKSGFEFDNCQFITEQKDGLLRKGKLSREDVIMTTRGTIGNAAYFNRHVPYDNIRINSGMVIFRTNSEKLLPSFLYQYIRSEQFNKQVNSLRSGAAQPQLPIRDIKVIELPLPSISQQRSISNLISKYDDLIENNKRRIELLEESARQLYKEWFVRFRFPGHEHVEIIDGAPEGWSKATYGEAAETVGGGTPSTKIPEYWEDGTVTWFVPKDLTQNISLVLLDSEKKITELGLQKSSAKILPPNTIMMSSRASIGYFGLYDGAASTNQGFISVIPKQSNTQMYLLHNLISRKEEIIGLAGGTTYKEINKSTFRAIELYVPTEKLLNEFQEYVTDIVSQVRLLMKQIQQLSRARDILLPKLMSGELAV